MTTVFDKKLQMYSPILTVDGVLRLYDGTYIQVHSDSLCKSDSFCCIHKPSTHALTYAPMIFDFTILVMHRVCKHFYVHPDPDALLWWVNSYAAAWMEPKPTKIGVRKWLAYRYADIREHDCDGCCQFPLYVTNKFYHKTLNVYLRVNCSRNGWTQIAKDLS